MIKTHGHVEINSADCDGQMTHEYISWPNEGQDEYEFKRERIALDVSPYSYSTLTTSPDSYEVSEQTEEGYYNVEVRWCEDDCEDEKSYRDHRAEAAGY